MLAALALGNRRKFPVQDFLALPRDVQDCTRRLCVILRIAVLLRRGRSGSGQPGFELLADGETLSLGFPEGWLEGHPLTLLELEADLLASAGITLGFH